jgi:DNA-directed RNA polymerase subunit H (RpoH/RPB5)
MATHKLYQIEMSAEDVRKKVLTNTIKMVTNRGLLKFENLDLNIENVINATSDDMSYTIKLDTNDDNNQKVLAIKYAPHKITAVNKSYGTVEFLNNYKDSVKIVIVKSISKKAYQQFLKNYSQVEIFMEEELMRNLVDHVLVPKHEMLTDDEVIDFYDKFNCKKKNMPKIQSTEPVARYYAMQPGNICRVIRPSEKSGFTTTYRLVVKGAQK